MAITIDAAVQNGVDPSLSGDGNTIAYEIANGNQNGVATFNEASRQTIVVQPKASGPEIAASVPVVVFASSDNTLPNANGKTQVYTQNFLANSPPKLASSDNMGNPGDGNSFDQVVSQDGTSVGFDSDSSNLDPRGGSFGGNTPSLHQELELAEGDAGIADDRRFDSGQPAQAFWIPSRATARSSGSTAPRKLTSIRGSSTTTTSTEEAYVKDFNTHQLTLVSKLVSGNSTTIADGSSSSVVVSGDGKSVAFVSNADNLGFATNGNTEIYENAIGGNAPRLVSALPASTNGVETPAAGGTNTSNPVFSDDGNYVAFESDAPNLPGSNGQSQVYVKNLQTDTLTLVSQDASGNAGNGSSTLGNVGNQGFSADDTKLTFQTTSNLAGANPTGQEIVRANSGPAPSVTLDPINAPFSAAQAASGITVTGNATAGDTVNLYLENTLGTPVGTQQMVGADGKFTINLKPGAVGPGQHTFVATVQGDSKNSYLSGINSESFSVSMIGTPTANDQNTTTAFGAPETITLTGSDPDSPALPLSYSIAGQPSHGTLSNFDAGKGTVTYTPNAGYSGSDTFTFTDNNGTNTSGTAAVGITVGAPPPSVAFTPGVTFSNAHTATLTGTVSDPSVKVTGVESSTTARTSAPPPSTAMAPGRFPTPNSRRAYKTSLRSRPTRPATRRNRRRRRSPLRPASRGPIAQTRRTSPARATSRAKPSPSATVPSTCTMS